MTALRAAHRAARLGRCRDPNRPSRDHPSIAVSLLVGWALIQHNRPRTVEQLHWPPEYARGAMVVREANLKIDGSANTSSSAVSSKQGSVRRGQSRSRKFLVNQNCECPGLLVKPPPVHHQDAPTLGRATPAGWCRPSDVSAWPTHFQPNIYHFGKGILCGVERRVLASDVVALQAPRDVAVAWQRKRSSRDRIDRCLVEV